MATFPLRIGTPDGLLFEGNAERIVCRSITGDLAILAGHINYCTALGMGEAHVVLEDGTVRRAACIGGMRLDLGGKRFDGTIRQRLDKIRSVLAVHEALS